MSEVTRKVRFTPVTIILESQEEIDVLGAWLNISPPAPSIANNALAILNSRVTRHTSDERHRYVLLLKELLAEDTI